MVLILKSIPIVEINDALNESSENRNKIQVYNRQSIRSFSSVCLSATELTFPTPLSPMSNNLKRRS